MEKCNTFSGKAGIICRNDTKKLFRKIKEKKKMEPAVGFEPTTDGLQNRSSTTELSWLGY